MKIFFIYMAAITLVTVIITVYDKYAAKKRPKNRVPEKTLLLFGILGGALGEYITMLAIRHKTKHKKFMLGLPLILILHTVLAAALFIRNLFF